MMVTSDKELIAGVRKRDIRALSRVISLIEDRAPRSRGLQAQLFKFTGKAHVIGVTGAPGAGKSTMVDQIALLWRKKGKKVAILAVDPSSPFSGGAVLGDRIRMVRAAADPKVYIRSMATRGSLGGIAAATSDAISVLDAAGFDIILVETVGVGQAEIDIVQTADTTLVVLVPGMGDGVQIIKAGIIEIADVFVINKADREGADILQKELRVLMSLNAPVAGAWAPEIVRTVATAGQGLDELLQSIDSHRKWYESSSIGLDHRLSMIEHSILRIASDSFDSTLRQNHSQLLKSLSRNCYRRELDPHSAAEALVSTVTRSR